MVDFRKPSFVIFQFTLKKYCLDHHLSNVVSQQKTRCNHVFQMLKYLLTYSCSFGNVLAFPVASLHHFLFYAIYLQLLGAPSSSRSLSLLSLQHCLGLPDGLIQWVQLYTFSELYICDWWHALLSLASMIFETNYKMLFHWHSHSSCIPLSLCPLFNMFYSATYSCVHSIPKALKLFLGSLSISHICM